MIWRFSQKFMLIDSHTHVNFPSYDLDRQSVIKRAQKMGIKMICVGTQISTSTAAIKLAEEYPNDIWATVGFHPSHLNQQWYHDPHEQKEAVPEKFNIEKLRTLAKHPKVVAIGECGLDYYRIINENLEIKDLQKKVFLEQAQLAQELKKPLMIHCRPTKRKDDAYNDLLS